MTSWRIPKFRPHRTIGSHGRNGPTRGCRARGLYELEECRCVFQNVRVCGGAHLLRFQMAVTLPFFSFCRSKSGSFSDVMPPLEEPTVNMCAVRKISTLLSGYSCVRLGIRHDVMWRETRRGSWLSQLGAFTDTLRY